MLLVYMYSHSFDNLRFYATIKGLVIHPRKREHVKYTLKAGVVFLSLQNELSSFLTKLL